MAFFLHLTILTKKQDINIYITVYICVDDLY